MGQKKLNVREEFIAYGISKADPYIGRKRPDQAVRTLFAIQRRPAYFRGLVRLSEISRTGRRTFAGVRTFAWLNNNSQAAASILKIILDLRATT